MPYANPAAQRIATAENTRRYRARKQAARRGITAKPSNPGITALQTGLALHPMTLEERKLRLSEIARAQIAEPLPASAAIGAVAELNRMERVYDDRPPVSNNVLVVNVLDPDAGGRLLDGLKERTAVSANALQLMQEAASSGDGERDGRGG